MKSFNLIAFILIIFSTVQSCGKKAGGVCNSDSDCKKNLRCVSQKCRPYISCEELRNKYHKCIKEIATVRNPSVKIEQTELNQFKINFDRSFFKECQKDRGTYDDSGIKECLKKLDCSAFASCLLSLEKKIYTP
ncbi:hypothetical protein KKF34_01105 [Myxococcota bacterium]|nr:hypothetical protein [Myxococcota bacterium]MBU1380390.1 hypothetical protein [Myxococcota bacterium]MBU1495460.1 hypothetical protein [Myxococcota bacterium]